MCATSGLADLFAVVVHTNKTVATKDVYEAKDVRRVDRWPDPKAVSSNSADEWITNVDQSRTGFSA